MKTYYYLDWFYEKGFSEKLVNALQEDITDRRLLVMIGAESPQESNGPVSIEDVFERTWFHQANIFFDEYRFIDHRTPKEDAQRLVQSASVLFLCGGDPQSQKRLLTEYDLSALIPQGNAVVMGTSAGGMNMSSAYVDGGSVYEGIALHGFSFEAHFDYGNTALIEERFPLSQIMDIYVASSKNGAVRVQANKIDIIGDVYRISRSKIQKMAETL